MCAKCCAKGGLQKIMVDLPTLLLFIGATFILVATPGPIVALVLAETLKHGPKYGVAVVLGAQTVGVIILTAYILGAAPLLAALNNYIPWIQAIGIAYLFYLGLRLLLKRHETTQALNIKARVPSDAYKASLVVTASSPKTILFFAAFFPQFIDYTVEIVPQLVALSITFIILTVILDLSWVLIARTAKAALEKRGMQRKLNTISGIILIFAAVMLAIIDL